MKGKSKLQIRREEKRLTIWELAEKCGHSFHEDYYIWYFRLWRYETNKNNNFKKENLMVIAKILKCTVEDLIEDEW